MQKIGYALVRLSDGAVIERWDGVGHDPNGRPMLRLVIPDQKIAVHSPDIGTEYYGFKFVERLLDDPGRPSRFHSETDKEKFTGNAVVVARSYPDAPDIVPMTVPMVKAKLTLLAAGRLDEVDAVIAGLDPKVLGSRAVQLMWEYSTDIRRSSPELAQIASVVGLTEPEIDDLFRQAASS